MWLPFEELHLLHDGARFRGSLTLRIPTHPSSLRAAARFPAGYDPKGSTASTGITWSTVTCSS